jgi:hypothetical protein
MRMNPRAAVQADSDTAIAPVGARASPFKIDFFPPGARRWLIAMPRTRWRWTGKAELQFDGNETILRGRRARRFLPTAPQEIHFPSSDVLDVNTSGAAVQCQVKQPEGKPEPLSFWASDANAAQFIAARWPKEQSVGFQERAALTSWPRRDSTSLRGVPTTGLRR